MISTSMSTGRNILLIPFLLSIPLLLTGCGERTQPMEETTETMTDDSDEIILNANLSGGNEGDADGSGSANVTIDREAAEVCYEIEVSNIDDPTMAHIHEGAEGESGGVVVNFNTPENGMNSCLSGVDDSQIDNIIESPGDFYVNVHNAEYPGGAVRGQLMNQ